MTSKFTSLSELIERVYRGTDLESIAWQDAAEDTLDVLRLIGVPQSYIDKTTNGQLDNPVPIIITNFRGELPSDLAVPGACRLVMLDSNYNIASFKMMIESTDLFYMSPTVLEEYNTAYNISLFTLPLPHHLNLSIGTGCIVLLSTSADVNSYTAIPDLPSIILGQASVLSIFLPIEIPPNVKVVSYSSTSNNSNCKVFCSILPFSLM